MTVQTLRRLRQFHHVIGVFLAPAIIFFAISGGLQTFRLHEAKGWGGTPPGWIVWMGAAHMDQAPPRAKAQKPEAAKLAGAVAAAFGFAAPAAAHSDEAPPRAGAQSPEAATPVAVAQAAKPAAGKAPDKSGGALPLKIFVAVMAVGLVLSSLLGVVIAVNNRAMRRLSILMLVAGAMVPLLLMPG